MDHRPDDPHLLDADDPGHREALITSLGSPDPRERTAAVTTLSMSRDETVAKAAVLTGYQDGSRLVRRTGVDAAADLEDGEYRPMFEAAIDDEDPWIRWRAVRAISDLGAGPSRETLMFAAVDDDSRVRSEAIAALNEAEDG